jgi:catechol 2,3-dioxygenase-like lactoylglutathione lyase family enzyme
MATILHMSFRVRDPERAAALYAELLDGEAADVGPVLGPIGVKGVSFGRNRENALSDIIELWPLGKHWAAGGFTEVAPAAAPFGHLAVESDKPLEALAAIAQKHGLTLAMEERGMTYLVPVIYDYDGNFIEFFARSCGGDSPP